MAESRVQPAGLVLVSVPASFCQRPDYPWGQPSAAVRAMRRGLKNDPGKIIKEFAWSCLSPEEESFKEEVANFFRSGEKPTNLASGLDYLLNHDLRPLLSRALIKPLIIQGDQDDIVPLPQAKYLHQNLPESRLVLFPGAGHLPFLTQASAFNRLLEKEILRGRQGLQSALTSNSSPKQH